MSKQMSQGQSELSLDEGWMIVRADDDLSLDFPVPGDVHSVLRANELIPDPYWRDVEESLDWVHESEWIASTSFSIEDLPEGRFVLSLDGIDCHADVILNGIVIGHCESQFLRFDFEAGHALRKGQNRLMLHFASNSAIAKGMQEVFPFPVPYIYFNNRLPHYNFLRKAQCHAGWDWNIALSPIGIYGKVSLKRVSAARLDDVLIRQHHHKEGSVTLEIIAYYEAHAPAELTLAANIDGQVVSKIIKVWPGEGKARLRHTIEEPHLWWPAGHGEQALYDLTVMLDGQSLSRRIGLRTVELVTDADEIGNRFAFRINGREIFCRGANWIPADALPARATPDAVRDLLTSAIEANMNMIRVWGGGQYEPDWFYDLCSELGLMVWHDFMFACNLYPSSDRHWLSLVRREARQQLRRLSGTPCLALWCGDNELVGALTWFEESKANRDRYLAMYERLNFALEECVEEEAPDVPFWPSSPSVGPFNFGDGWHDDTAGDMHFWDVWHSAKDFEHYRTVRPRFCSEFGFQSFPSMRVIESFTEEEDRNVSSPVMDVHQRNEGGNSRIVETIARYFRFPDGFADMTYLSQVGQALAMKTAIEFWRAAKPRCMGTLYWQLNDTWPVASWASLDYGGGWKLTQYLARRFYAPVHVTAQPLREGGTILLRAINDTPSPIALTVRLRRVALSGAMEPLGEVSLEVPTHAAVDVTRFGAEKLGNDAFLHFDWVSTDGAIAGENDYLPKWPKDYALGDPVITATRHRDANGGEEIALVSDRPAFFVTLDHGGDRVYSDNCFTLLPDVPKRISVLRERRSHLPAPRDGDALSIQYLKG